ncbi:MmgE/PrpD family protein [Chloroflexota bacterium]
MGEVTEKLAGFIAKAEYRDLPEDIIHETKRVLLDSIGCAIGGLDTDMGRVSRSLARKLGGPPISSIIGTADKVSPANSAFANGELINALDYDAGSAEHDTPIVIASSLAPAEGARASGQELITAIAVGHEVTTRLVLAGKEVLTIIKEGPDKGKVRFASSGGYGSTTLAAAASAGKVLRLDAEKMANAIGIAGYICSPNVIRKFLDTSPVRMTKYAIFGWGAQSGVTAALLAEAGFTGDTDVLDGEDSFWKYTGHQEWDTGRALAGIGSQWLHKISYKVYPSSFFMAGALDCFIRIIEENDLKPEEIEGIIARVSPVIRHRMAQENKLKTPIDFSFSPPYCLACAAHRIPYGRWLDPEVRGDSRLHRFIKRVEFDIGFNEKEFGLARLKNPGAILSSAEVIARGKAYKQQTLYNKGSAAAPITDEELSQKFRENVSSVLLEARSERIIKTVFELEKVKRAAELMEMLVP